MLLSVQMDRVKMAVQSEYNQFLGVNPHLHSYWQAENKWNRFHSLFIAQILFDLKKRLNRMGYSAEPEESLQIRRYGDTPYRPQSDVLIRDTDPLRFDARSAPILERSVPLTALEGNINTETSFQSIAVYTYKNYEAGELVGWIEVLSPANKQGVDALTYQGRRRVLLQQGIVFIEIDMLHETPPTFARIADYTSREPNSTPYRVIMLEPRPNFRHTQALVKSIAVDSPLPTVRMALNGDDTITINLEAIYQTTYHAASYGFDMTCDALPMRFHTYSPDDQARIATRMAHVLAAHQRGVNLETAHAPLEALPLDQAITLLEMLGVTR